MKNLLILLFIFLVACTQEPKTENEIAESQIDNIPKIEDTYQSLEIESEEGMTLMNGIIDTIMTFQHNNVEFKIGGTFFLEEGKVFEIAENQDTLYAYFLGLDFLELAAKHKKQLNIYQSYIENLTINYDSKNPFILENWKESQSKWKLIKDNDDLMKSDTTNTQFPTYTKEELIEAIKSNFSHVDVEFLEEWLLDKVDDMLTNYGNSEPYLDVQVTKTVFKIEDIESKTPLFYIILYYSSGC